MKPLAFTTLVLCAACQAPPPAGPEPSPGAVAEAPASEVAPRPSIDKLQLQATPTVVNLDEKPGADGVQVRLLLWRSATPLAALLDQGTVEFLLFDGRVAPAQLSHVKPTQIWKYSAEQLRGSVRQSPFGPCYALELAWSDHPPRQGVVTISARLLDPEGRALYAEPLNLAVGPR